MSLQPQPSTLAVSMRVAVLPPTPPPPPPPSPRPHQTDIDECANTALNDCVPPAACVNSAPTADNDYAKYTCACPVGYMHVAKPDGQTCTGEAGRWPRRGLLTSPSPCTEAWGHQAEQSQLQPRRAAAASWQTPTSPSSAHRRRPELGLHGHQRGHDMQVQGRLPGRRRRAVHG